MAAEGTPAGPVLIHGGTGAIGLAAARSLVRSGRSVVLWVRDGERGEAARRSLAPGAGRSAVSWVGGDLARLHRAREVAERLLSEHARFAAVIHAAGILTRRREETEEGLERMFATNFLGPSLLLRMLIRAQGPDEPLRIITVSAPTSAPIHFDDLQSRRRFSSLSAFGQSKAAALLFAFALARRLRPGPRTSNAFSPGVVRSALFREAPLTVRLFVRMVGARPESAGDALAWLATGAPLASTSGVFFEGTRVGSAPEYAQREENQERLWAAGEDLLDELGVNPGPPPSSRE